MPACPSAVIVQPTRSASGGSPGLEPLRLAKPIPAFLDGSKRMFLGNKLYTLLVFVPLAFLAEHLEFSDAAIFGMACLAILPLAGLLGEATEQVALHTNETVGGLLNATFGNATEMIVCYFALKANLLDVVKVSLLGSILSNSLLVMGSAQRRQPSTNPLPTLCQPSATLCNPLHPRSRLVADDTHLEGC